jgi:hypothetical protein
MPPVPLTAITTGFNNPIGIDYHEPTNRVVMSVNYSSGTPYNFELVAQDGTRTPFSTVSGFTEEVKIATVRSGPNQGGFSVGDLFTGTGSPGVVARISADGTIVDNPWVVLPNETGLLRGSLFHDRYGVFGGDLIVATTAGNIWRITSGAVASQLASLPQGSFEALTTVPNDPARYGPWAGKIVVGASQFFTVDGAGNTEAFDIRGLAGDLEDIAIIPDGENFFGVDFAGQTLWGAPPAAFVGMVGDFLVAQEGSGALFHLRWDPASSSFQSEQVADVGTWEHVTFSSAGIQEIPPARGDCMESCLSVTVRDSHHPCAPYQSTGHSFNVEVYHCDGLPLFWKGVNFGKGVPLQIAGAGGGLVHGQFRVPSGCYLVRAVATCQNVVTDWAWANIGCGATVCVDLVPPMVRHCIERVVAGLVAGTVDDQPLGEVVGDQAARVAEALREVAASLPDQPLPPPPLDLAPQ